MKRKKRRNTLFKRYSKSIFVSLLFAVISWFILEQQQKIEVGTQSASHASEENHEKDAQLYANQSQDDLTRLYLTAIENANHSIHLIIYSLTDPHIISALLTQSQKGVAVHVVSDAKASPELEQKLGSKAKIVRRFGPGLMHQKLLAIDGKYLLVGSANLTSESLKMHGNLVTAIESEAAAKMVMAKTESLKIEGRCQAFPWKSFQVGSQNMELWFLPDNRAGLERIKELLAAAKKTVQVAMFAWTRRDLAQSAIQAAQRGVKVDLVIDSSLGKGIGAKIVKLLKQKGIEVSLSPGGPLLHHKFLLIDGEILVNGSANWTRNAFNLNDDCFIVLGPLNEKQKKQMQRLWTEIKNESVPQ